MEIAAHFLSTRPRTRREVELRLRRAAVSTELIGATLERLESLGLIDDVAFTRWWAEQRDRHAPRGRRMVESELRSRGVPRDVLEALRGEELAEPALAAEAIPGSEAERAAAALARHLRGRPLPGDTKAVQRVGAFLMRRGFDPETVRATLRAAGRDAPDEA
ncbi:MAG: regulatory protein RecX [Chloroflexota bacterium]